MKRFVVWMDWHLHRHWWMWMWLVMIPGQALLHAAGFRPWLAFATATAVVGVWGLGGSWRVDPPWSWTRLLRKADVSYRESCVAYDRTRQLSSKFTVVLWEKAAEDDKVDWGAVRGGSISSVPGAVISDVFVGERFVVAVAVYPGGRGRGKRSRVRRRRERPVLQNPEPSANIVG